VFKNNIEKRIRSLPEIDGLSKETVLSSWMAKFDQIFRGDDDPRKRPQRQSAATSEMILTKEQLYDMFQNILSIKKYEHQILYNAMQVRVRLLRLSTRWCCHVTCCHVTLMHVTSKGPTFDLWIACRLCGAVSQKRPTLSSSVS